jgi:hypothetical protein
VSNVVHDPLLNRTFGARMSGSGFVRDGVNRLKTARPITQFDLSIATHTAQSPAIADWEKSIAHPVSVRTAARRTASWWNQFWNRSWISVRENGAAYLPASSRPLQIGVDSAGGSRFAGEITNAIALERVLSAGEIAALANEKPGSQSNQLADISLRSGFTLAAWIKPAPGEFGRIFDKITAFGSDGFMLDAYPGLSLRLNVGGTFLSAPNCLKPGEWQHVAVTVDAQGDKQIYLNGKLVKHDVPLNHAASRITQAYVLQRWMTACAGRGNYPIKFNGSIFTVESKFAGGPNLDADWRRWGDCYWWQNMRFPSYPMMASGDFDEVHPLFHAYENVLPLCTARAKLYYQADGAYFPETMTIFGTYANADYGWVRGDHPSSEILNPWWRYAWQQGLELTALMLDYYEYTGDKKFLHQQLVPMANAVLRYYDTRFKRDALGKLVISPTQVVETYRNDVLNDTPSVAGLMNVCERLLKLPASSTDREFWQRMRKAVPAIPIQDGRILPAEKFGPERSNIENPELYALWPFRLYGIGHPNPEIAVQTFEHQIEKSSIGWQYDGQCAAIAGLAEEAGRLLVGKVRNSNPNFRFPAMWGPNYDWLPDQDHGANLMLTLQNMILQSVGKKIYVLPSWPKKWDVSFRLHAPQDTIVEGVYENGKLVTLKVSPESRRKDVEVLLLKSGNNSHSLPGTESFP